MFWAQFSFGVSALAVAGFLGFIVMRDHPNVAPVFDHGGDSQKLAATQSPPATAQPPSPPQTAPPGTAAMPALPTSGVPPIVGNLVVANPTAGAERLAALVHSLGGQIDTSAGPAQSTIYVSIPPSARAAFQTRLPEIGAWQGLLTGAEGNEAIIGIRVIQRP
jgi:hypothetical protein